MQVTFLRMLADFRLTILVLLVLCVPATVYSDEALESEVQHLIRQHYVYGLPYPKAKSLGSEAIPFLSQMLNDRANEEYWVNTIVALGFIEESSAFTPLKEYIENASGEVDLHTFKALASVPFAMGCLASTGDQRPYDYLKRLMRFSQSDTIDWQFSNTDTTLFIAGEAATALAISGLDEARVELEDAIARIESGDAPRRQAEILQKLQDGLSLWEQIREQGRAAVFNPY